LYLIYLLNDWNYHLYVLHIFYWKFTIKKLKFLLPFLDVQSSKIQNSKLLFPSLPLKMSNINKSNIIYEQISSKQKQISNISKKIDPPTKTTDNLNYCYHCYNKLTHTDFQYGLYTTGVYYCQKCVTNHKDVIADNIKEHNQWLDECYWD
jgi:hypothetical protein